MRPIDDLSADFRERVPTGSARRRLLIPPVLDQKARINTTQGCQQHAVILPKKRSRSSNWRIFTTNPCTKTSISLFSMLVSEYSVQAPVLPGFIYTFYNAIIIDASRHPASRINAIASPTPTHCSNDIRGTGLMRQISSVSAMRDWL